ncbi:GSCOCG00002454001-RA-CDS [Cotesia congregata]|nr:GSCOCG00002454001-RA-CDS [Cotesia congregata]
MQFGTAAVITIFQIQQNIPVFTQIDDDFFPLRPSTTRVGDDIIVDDDLICEFHISSMNVTILAHAGFLTARVIQAKDTVSVWEVCSIPLAKNEIVTCVFIFADLLLIGLNTGDINVYAIENIKSLLDTALIFKNLRVIKVGTSPIIAINSTEIKKKSYIVASTKSKLFAINISV